jgi:hypothetical protein
MKIPKKKTEREKIETEFEKRFKFVDFGIQKNDMKDFIFQQIENVLEGRAREIEKLKDLEQLPASKYGLDKALEILRK